jgi:hypothetical protein
MRTVKTNAAVLLAAAAGAAFASEDKEPEHGYTLYLNGRAIRVPPNENQVIRGTLVDPSIRLVPDRERRVTFGGLAFAYPSDFAFNADFSTVGARQWTLDGNDFVIMVQQWERAKVGPEELAIQLRLTYGKAVVRKPVSYRLNGQDYSGIRVTYEIAGSTLFQDVLGLPSERGSRLLILQGLVEQEKGKEATRVMKLLDETLEVGP